MISPHRAISPDSRVNVTIRRGKGHPRSKKNSLSSYERGDGMEGGNFRDVLVTMELDRVLRALDPSKGGS